MKRLIALLFVVALLPQTALWAEDAPKVEVFGGFSSLTVKPVPIGNKITVDGWQASVAAPIKGPVSMLGDVGGQYHGGNHSYEFLAGLLAATRTDKTSLSAHALYGLATAGGPGVLTENKFMMGYGLAFDVKVHERIAFRVIQFDWLPSLDSGLWQYKQVRFGFGAVYRVKSE